MGVLYELGVLVEMFRRWMHEKFGSQSKWFSALEADLSGNVFKDSFAKLCVDQGFDVTDHELEELFGLCDISHKDYISKDQTIFLEIDDVVRDRELLFLKLNQKYEQDRMLLDCFHSNYTLPIKHRLAIRPWVKHKYEALPTIGRQRVVARDNVLRRSSLQARMRFIRHLRNFHGTEIRAWRRGLDPDGKFVVNKSVFKQYCRAIQFEDDVKALWISLDPAGEGQLRIEQFSLQATDLLVSFRAWCISSFGSCLGLFQSMEAKKRRRQRRGDGSYFVKPSMSVNAFSSLLWAYGYPPLLGPDGDAIVWYLTTTLDLHGGSFISFSDLKWLDGWQPTEWLVTEPDHGAWLEIRSDLEAEFGNLLRAWRRELDVDNSNKFTWPQWQEACRKRGIDTGLVVGY